MKFLFFCSSVFQFFPKTKRKKKHNHLKKNVTVLFAYIRTPMKRYIMIYLNFMQFLYSEIISNCQNANKCAPRRFPSRTDKNPYLTFPTLHLIQLQSYIISPLHSSSFLFSVLSLPLFNEWNFSLIYLNQLTVDFYSLTTPGRGLPPPQPLQPLLLFPNALYLYHSHSHQFRSL